MSTAANKSGQMKMRVQFASYGNSKFFMESGEQSAANVNVSTRAVIAAGIKGVTITNLTEPLVYKIPAMRVSANT